MGGGRGTGDEKEGRREGERVSKRKPQYGAPGEEVWGSVRG